MAFWEIELELHTTRRGQYYDKHFLVGRIFRRLSCCDFYDVSLLLVLFTGVKFYDCPYHLAHFAKRSAYQQLLYPLPLYPPDITQENEASV